MGRGSKKKREDARMDDESFREDLANSNEPDGPATGDSVDEEPIELSEIDVLRAEIDRANEERELFEDKLKHALADMSNMRRRASEEAVRAREQAVGRVTQEILPVLDAFDLALASDGDREALLEGVRLVRSMLEDLLSRHGVEVVDAQDATFDPKFHEAIATEARDDVAAGTIVAVHQAGYRMRDRVLRPARVVVASEARHEGPEIDAEETED